MTKKKNQTTLLISGHLSLCSLPPFPKLTLLTFGNMCFVWWQNTALESGVLSQSLVWEQSQASRQLLSIREQMGWIIF